jgi:hypothetical protein
MLGLVPKQFAVEITPDQGKRARELDADQKARLDHEKWCIGHVW